MKNPESRAGTWGWVGLATYVVAWDLLAPETLSSAADRALEHPVGKYVAPVVGAVVLAHVMNTLDHYEYPDPIKMTSDFITDGLRKLNKSVE